MLSYILYAAVAIVAALIVGAAAPNSIPGRFVNTALAALGLKARRYEEANALARVDRELAKQNDRIVAGIGGLAEQRANVKALDRERQSLEASVADLETKIDLLDDDGVPDDDKTKLDLAALLGKRLTRLEHVKERHDAAAASLLRFEDEVRAAHDHARDAAEGRDELAAEYAAAQAAEQVHGAMAAFQGVGGRDGLRSALDDARRQVDRVRGRAEATHEVFGPDAAARRLDDKLAARKAQQLLEARRARKGGPAA